MDADKSVDSQTIQPFLTANDSESFWQTWLADFPGIASIEPLCLPSASTFTTPQWCTYPVELAAELSQSLTRAAHTYSIDKTVLSLGLWSLLLSRYSSQTDLVFGVVGISQAPLPMRVRIDPQAKVSDWLVSLQTHWQAFQSYSHVSLQEVSAWSNLPEDVLQFDSLLVFARQADSGSSLLALEGLPTFSIALLASSVDPSQLVLRYYSGRIDEDAVIRLAGHLQTLLAGMVANPQKALAELPLLTPAERHQILFEWNNTQVEYPREQCIHQLFEQQVQKTPEAIAVVLPILATDSKQQLTYRDLNDRANALTVRLQTLGVGRGTFVAICMERTIELIVAIVGILKAGGVYVPIDPAYPAERIAWMLTDTQAPVIITQSHLADQLPPHNASIVCLDQNWGADSAVVTTLFPETTAADLAYVNYTSGSTGKPKGVAIPHQGVTRLVFGTNFTPLDGTQTLLQLAPISFDAATFEIWGALLHGGCCVLYPASGIPDSRLLKKILWEQQISTLFLTTALFNALVAEIPDALLPVREVLTGGEAISIPHIRKALTQLPETTVIHVYGPTESTTFACSYRIPRQIEASLTTLPIGKPIANTEFYVLDEKLQPVPIGVAGELYIGGDGLAREYLNRPDLTQERFISHPFSQISGARLYKTGDQVRYLPDGNVEFIGRQDNQVKMRGFRIELGEIEAVLRQHESVADVRVILREDTPGNKCLVAYLIAQENHPISIQSLKDFLRQRLAAFMVPAAMMVLDQLPLSPTGKVDRKALPIPARGGQPEHFVAPGTRLEKELAEIWGSVLGLDQVGIEDNFFDLGGTSLMGMQVMTRIQKRYDPDLRAVLLYQYPTIKALANYLSRSQQPQLINQVESLQRSPVTSNGVAIIGMVGRFPGASSIEELWHNLCEAKESITFFSDAEIDPSETPELRHDPHYVRARGVLQDAEQFDAAFFGISPREAEVMDPQARVFLELAQTALENAGYTPEAFAGAIGLYAGSGQNYYFERHICGRPEVVERLGAFQTMLANEKDFLTTRTAYKLNLTGPSLSINTACSTSLVATIQAVQSLLSHQCDLALAGGVSIVTPQNTGYLYQEGGMLSPDGHCRPFDANAQGTTFNSGAGIIVLKRLEDALADGDRIYAVIKGVGINNDGSGKVSFTAPSVIGQANAIAAAQADANFPAETISYIEAHGTATPLGDPIEVEALTQAFRLQTDATSFCAIGSIKSNIGHTVAAAGVAGLIKTALALHHKKIPASLGFSAPNSQIAFDRSPFYVNAKLREWAAGETPRRAGVSSFGVGGTNAHVVLEEAPALAPSSPSRPCQLLLLSAKTATALEQATHNLHKHLRQHQEVNLADVAYTLQRGRKGFNHRRFVVCSDHDEAIAALETLDVKHSSTRQTELRNPEIVFMFPGQGAQYVNMGLNLYEQESIFQEAVDRCAEILTPYLGRDLREVMYPAPDDQETAAASLKQTLYTQPALFTIEYALAQLWQSWGIQPQAMIGHSIGEFVAACLAGVFSLEDGLKLVATRGRMMWDLPGGSMLSVRQSADVVQSRLTAEMAIAAINGFSLCVVAGPTEAIVTLQQALEAEEIACKLLHTSHAFHSPMMEPVILPFTEVVKTIKLAPPTIPFVSTVTADWITDAQATDPLYWASHLRATVRFADGVRTLWQVPERVLLEVGPRATAATLARQQATDLKRQIAIASLGSSAENNAEWSAIMQAIGQLWLAGVSLDWQCFYAAETRHRIPLPTYPFERQRYWIDPKPAPAQSVPVQLVPALPENQASNLTLTNAPGDRSPSQTADIKPSSTRSEMSLITESRKQRLIPILKEVLETTSGLEMGGASETITFLELGLDSLSLTQVALALKKKFKIKITFRHLLEDCPNLDTLSDFIDRALPADALPAPTPTVSTASSETLSGSTPVMITPPSSSSMNGSSPERLVPPIAPDLEANGAIAALVAQQLQLMARQLELLGQAKAAPSTTIQPDISAVPVLAPVTPAPATIAPPATLDEAPKVQHKSRGPGARIEKSVSTELTSEQTNALNRIIDRYVKRTQESKRQTQEHRRYLADPRTVSGFTPLLKEMVYPIVTDRSAGSKLWDIDGNEYIDLTNGFGLNFFGWNPDFVKAAVLAQMEKGIEIGPQTPLAGKVAKLITEFTGMERVAFCNTGSEAVMATLRLARTVTGRDLVATFANDYHGTFDEALYRPGANLRTMPAAPGILPCMFENLLVLDYGTPESLNILRDRADDLAAILVEPVRSRDPGLQPKEFLQDLRRLTEQSGTAYIFDEVVTGFRVHPGGAQAYFGIQADMATYGKVVGGGLPIGILAGKADYLDALDGGYWEYGDASIPEVGVTFFAGTFVRHPMALAAAEAVLLKLREGGGELQRSLTEKVNIFATHLNQHFERVGAPLKIDHFSSFFYISYPTELPYAQLLFYLLREKGVHVWDHRPCFFTLSHTDAEIEFIVRALKDSVAELQMSGFLPSVTSTSTGANGNGKSDRNRPPQPGARLGKDPEGNPAWYIPDPERPGKYLQIEGVS